MQVAVPYGCGKITLQADERRAEWHIIKTESCEALKDPSRNFTAACRTPIASPPLRDIIKPTDRIVVVTSDGTRPFPNNIIIPWLLEELNLADDKITILLGNGTHRKNTPPEIISMFGEEIVRRIKIVNHDCIKEDDLKFVGITATNGRISLNRLYVEADKRIVLGFIEPHFFAGFSGGAKGIVPAVAAMETIMHIHRTELIADPKSTWGELERNPIQHEINEMVSACPPDFLINVTLNSERKITGFYCGDYRKAHLHGCAEVLKQSTVTVNDRFPLVITSNGGYPLDQNLYQTVKGISAAARIVEPGGTILVASECRDGIPSNGQFANLMSQGYTPDAILDHIRNLKQPIVDQWQAQILSTILQHAKIGIYSSLDSRDVSKCGMYHINDIQTEIEDKIKSKGKMIVAAVLPDGPLSIPTILDKFP